MEVAELETIHLYLTGNSTDCSRLNNSTVDLVVTSPPYPMIAMWDEMFISGSPLVAGFLERGEGYKAYCAMHELLDRTWVELSRVVKNGGIVCINIGDATRAINDKFQLYANHTRVVHAFEKLGFQPLPFIIWRKQTNAPNKFMGSGMLPAGAYVTLEHEYILIFRKAGRRIFTDKADNERRYRSAIFWEERNRWYSDLWEIKGASQNISLDRGRSRSAAFPLEIPLRLINMFSLQQDLVFDPFLGTGSTVIAAMTAGRNSVGYEIDCNLSAQFKETIQDSLELMKHYQEKRISDHLEFVKSREKVGLPLKYENDFYRFSVMTRQERNILIPVPEMISHFDSDSYRVIYRMGSNITCQK